MRVEVVLYVSLNATGPRIDSRLQSSRLDAGNETSCEDLVDKRAHGTLLLEKPSESHLNSLNVFPARKSDTAYDRLSFMRHDS